MEDLYLSAEAVPACIRLLTTMYGYVDAVATSFDSAPRMKKSISLSAAAAAVPEEPSLAALLRMTRFLSCSNTVYFKQLRYEYPM